MNINELLEKPVEELFWNVSIYPTLFSVDDLLDVFNLCTEENRKSVIKEMLSKAIELSDNSANVVNIDDVLHNFYSNSDPYSLKNTLLRNGVDINDIEINFKWLLLKYISLAVKNIAISEKEKSFFEELNIDYNNSVLLINLKNELQLLLDSSYDECTDCLVPLDWDSKNNLLSFVMFFSDLIQKWLNNPDRIAWKDVLSWHCVFHDSQEYINIIWENVVDYKIWDVYVPIDNFCSLDLSVVNNNTCPMDADILSMYNEWDNFIVVNPTYVKNVSDDNDDPYYCRFVDIISSKTWKKFRVLSW